MRQNGLGLALVYSAGSAVSYLIATAETLNSSVVDICRSIPSSMRYEPAFASWMELMLQFSPLHVSHLDVVSGVQRNP